MNDNRQKKRFRPSLFAESLESRQLLASSQVAATVAPITIKAAALSPPPVASVAVVRVGNPALSYYETMVPGQRALGYDLTRSGRSISTNVPVLGVDLPAGGTLQLQVLTGLTYWNGRGLPNFTPVTGNTELNLNVSGQNLRIDRKSVV